MMVQTTVVILPASGGSGGRRQKGAVEMDYSLNLHSPSRKFSNPTQPLETFL